MKKLSVFVLALLVCISSVLAGCGASKPAETPSSKPEDSSNQAPAGGGVIKIGSIQDLSGGMAAAGKATKWGSEYAVKKINDAGGINGNKLELVTYDVKGDPKEAIAAYKRLVEQDKVVAVIGPGLSNIGIPLSPIAEEMKVPVVAHFMDERATTNEQTGKAWKYTYLAEPSCNQQAEAIASYSVEKLGVKTVGILADNSNAYSMTHAEPFKKYVESKGVKVTAFETFGKDAKDYKAQLSKIIATNPDAIFVPAYVQQNALAYKQARQLGYKGLIVGNNTYAPPFDTLTEGTDLKDLYIIFNVDFGGDYAKELAQAYKDANNGESPLPNAAFGYDNICLVANALSKVDDVSDSVKINDAIEKQTKEVMTSSGPITINPETHRPEGMGVYIATYTPERKIELLEYYLAK